MLPPDRRELFLSALCPPEGYQFDRGIGTTFSLDLLTLLVAPLSLALVDVPDAKTALSDPVLLLEGLRRYADRLSIFCQAGRIGIPSQDSYLYSFLEKMVVEVQAPGGGVFHPKVWLLRYEAEVPGDPALYRLLTLTRNLTFDRSWDLMLRLEGLVAQRKVGYSRNRPLGDFVQALPELAVGPIDPRINRDVDLLQQEVRRVEFRAPEPFGQEIAFHPLGIPRMPRFHFDQGAYRALIVSPFLSDPVLKGFTARGAGHILVSRVDSLTELEPATQARFDKLYALEEYGPENEERDPVEAVGQEQTGAKPEPAGLHAKLYVLEAGWDATWLVGSANATSPALLSHKNVEFLVELRGKKSKVGIDQVLGAENDKNTFRALLKPFTATSAPSPVDVEQKQAEELAGSVRDWLIKLGLSLEVEQQAPDRFRLVLHAAHREPKAPEGEYRIAAWPVTLPEGRKMGFDLSSLSTHDPFSELSLLALTPFMAFDVQAQVGNRSHELRFALNLPISGIPEEDREARLLQAIVSDRSRFLRCLWLILAAGEENEQSSLSWLQGDARQGRNSWAAPAEMPLLEALVRAISRSPEKIEPIARLVERLQRTAEGRAVLPDGFEAFWDLVLQTRSALQ